jgi:hypothetical protein
MSDINLNEKSNNVTKENEKNNVQKETTTKQVNNLQPTEKNVSNQEPKKVIIEQNKNINVNKEIEKGKTMQYMGKTGTNIIPIMTPKTLMNNNNNNNMNKMIPNIIQTNINQKPIITTTNSSTIINSQNNVNQKPIITTTNSSTIPKINNSHININYLNNNNNKNISNNNNNNMNMNMNMNMNNNNMMNKNITINNNNNILKSNGNNNNVKVKTTIEGIKTTTPIIMTTKQSNVINNKPPISLSTPIFRGSYPIPSKKNKN